MAYICESCGVVSEKENRLCKPIDQEYKHKSCSIPEVKVCEGSLQEIEYSCSCGNVSADPQHLCHPEKINY